MNIRNVCNFETMLQYFGENLEWGIDTEDFNAEEYYYELYVKDLGYDELGIGIEKDQFAEISFLYQMKPFNNMPFGVFAVTFESKKLEIAALKKILSKLITKKRNNPDFPTWDMKDLIFLCFWGESSSKKVGIACFDDNDKNLPQLKIEYCEVGQDSDYFENKISHLIMPRDTKDIETWKSKWKQAFSANYRQQITDSKKLAHELAILAQNTRKTIISTYKVETGLGYVHLLYKKFKENLVHDLTSEQFADMYAQTIAYGLFSAKCMDTNEHFVWRDTIDNIPNTNPFLKSLIKSCFEKDTGNNTFFDELELAEIINLLDNTNINNILEHFNRHTGGGREDTVIYFYEDFLSEYEHDTKKRRGVFYTPWPVVKFMVRAVDDILKTEFGFKDGLADTAMKLVDIKRESKKKNKNGIITQIDDKTEVPAIQILDPATGTGTFLREVILQIYDTFRANNKGKSEAEIKKLWNEYVPEQLLPRLNGFELMMAPYAVAHMKLAMVLKDTGYDFESDERLRVVLTNTLEPSSTNASFMDEGQQMSFLEDPLAAEAFEADKTKNNQGINVIIGNPPYSGISSNSNEFISNLIEDYKYIDGVHFGERKHWLQDDYVKFIRYCEHILERSDNGILAFINNNGFLSNPTFRCMRWHLMKSFDSIYIVDLHGNSKKLETAPDGSKDENVFDIMQGVSISIYIKKKSAKKDLSTIMYSDLYGTREYKYKALEQGNISFHNIYPCMPYYLFGDYSNLNNEKYLNSIKIADIFLNKSVGFVTANDTLNISFSLSEHKKKIHELLVLNESEWRIKYNRAKDSRDWTYNTARNDILQIDDSYYKKIVYRPFDYRSTYYTGKSRGLYSSPQNNIMKLFMYNNIGLITAKSNKSDTCDHFYITKYMSETKCGERTTQSAVFPLFTYSKALEKTIRTPNLKSEIVADISEKLGLPFAPDSDGGSTESFAPIDLLDYIYAVLHSPKYRETYKEFLKIDFPRVPYPTDKEIFWKMVKLGGEIRKLHLMESPLFDTLITTYPVTGTNEVVKLNRKDNRVYINNEQYFEGISDLAWNFYIGGYQPAQKWLKDRKGKNLSDEDILHYQKIIVALTETDRLMKEIDDIFTF